MKVIICLALMLVVVCCEPKAPYLPSGWKPDGPAFLLPSEAQKQDDNPLKATIEVEAAGSDSLREYGPPAQDVTGQALPEVATEQTFSVKSEVHEDTDQNQEVENNEKEIVSNAQEGVAVENNETAENSVKTANVETATEKESEPQDVSANEITKEQRTQNIQDALSNLGQEISSQQVKSTEGADARTIQQEAGVPADSPAGLLEYGPPGFREYGPPQDIPTDFVRSSLDKEGSAPSTVVAEPLTTETRRRRFSPRLRTVRSQ